MVAESMGLIDWMDMDWLEEYGSSKKEIENREKQESLKKFNDAIMAKRNKDYGFPVGKLTFDKRFKTCECGEKQKEQNQEICESCGRELYPTLPDPPKPFLNKHIRLGGSGRKKV